jgi:hypothetical protein
MAAQLTLTRRLTVPLKNRALFVAQRHFPVEQQPVFSIRTPTGAWPQTVFHSPKLRRNPPSQKGKAFPKSHLARA